MVKPQGYDSKRLAEFYNYHTRFGAMSSDILESQYGIKDGRIKDPTRYYFFYIKLLNSVRPHIESGATLLDLGCGTGILAEIISGEVDKYVGVDISIERIKLCRKRIGYGNSAFVVADAQHLPFKNFSFDLIVSLEVIEHAPDTDLFIREAHRVLTRGGVSILSTPLNLFFENNMSGLYKDQHLYEFSIHTLKSFLKRNAFSIKSIRGIGFKLPEIKIPLFLGSDIIKYIYKKIKHVELKSGYGEPISLRFDIISNPLFNLCYLKLPWKRPWVLSMEIFGFFGRLIPLLSSDAVIICRKQMVRILQVIHSSQLSGPQRHLLDIARSIDRDRFYLEAACPDGWLMDELKKNGIITHRVELKDGFGIKSFLSLYRIVRRGGYNIIHAHMGRTGLYAKLAGAMAGKPVIVTEHLTSPDHSWIKNRFRRKLHLMGHKFFNRMVKLVIAVSQETRDTYIERQGISPERVITIHNFVDTDILASEDEAEEVRKEFGIDKDIIAVGFLGRLDWRKGLKTIVEAAEGLQGVKFLIVGEGDAREGLISEIKRKGLEELFILAGTRHDVPRVLKAMDIFIFPTEYESFGLAAVEAMAANKPVIASDIGSLREIIKDGKNGILIPPKDSDALRSSIIRLMNNRGLMKRLGEEGRRTALERFSSREGIREIEKVYEKVLER